MCERCKICFVQFGSSKQLGGTGEERRERKTKIIFLSKASVLKHLK